MMKEIIYTCDRCHKKQDYSMDELDCCTGYKTAIDEIEYKPFEVPIKGKAHLCEGCYKGWCKITCLFVFPITAKVKL